MIPKIVIDTNIYISAIFWGGKPREIVDMGRDGNILIFTPSEIEEEIVDKLKTKFRLNDQDANFIISDFSTFTTPVRIKKRFKVVLDDPEDDKFIECAVACGAEYIVTGDKHLLKIKEYDRIKILKASDFLTLITLA